MRQRLTMLMKLYHLLEQIRDVLNVAHTLLDRLDTTKAGNTTTTQGGQK